MSINGHSRISKLTKEMKSFQEYAELSHLHLDQLFIVWFLFARFGYPVDQAVRALPPRASDINLDAILIDKASNCVRMAQAKYHTKNVGIADPRNDVLAFAETASALSGSAERFETLLIGGSPEVRVALKEARKLVTQEDFSLCLYFVTTAHCSAGVKESAVKVAKRSGAQIEFVESDSVSALLEKYLDAAPPLGALDLPIQGGDLLHRIDRATKIHSWTFSMTGSSVGTLYEKYGDRLFALNVRGFQGDGKRVNKGMANTLNKEPQFFWFYNNGITLLCDDAKATTPSAGNSFLTVENPQIINGQQTTIMLSRALQASKASVSVRVIRVPPSEDNIAFDRLLSKIIKNTNSQQVISGAQLMSNDRRQIEIERQLERVDYHYIRKVQSKIEETASFGNQRFKRNIEMIELARAVAACEIDPSIVLRKGVDILFQDYYEDVFPAGKDNSFYLPRFWLGETVSGAIRTLPKNNSEDARAAKWLVIHFIWNRHLSSLVRGSVKACAFRADCEKKDSTAKGHLVKASAAVFRGSFRFFQSEKTDSADNFRDFLSHKNMPEKFERFWTSRENKSRNPFENAWASFEKCLLD